MVFQPGALDLARVVQVFWADEADDCVDLKGAVSSGQPITACFEGQLIPAVVGIGREFGALARLKI